MFFLGKRGNKTYQRGGGAKHEEDSWREPSHHSSVTTTRKMLFATLLRRQKKLIPNYEHHDPQKATLWVAYSATALSDTRTVADESTSRGKKQKNSNLSPGSKRRNSIRGKPRNNIGINSSSISQLLVMIWMKVVSRICTRYKKRKSTPMKNTLTGYQ